MDNQESEIINQESEQDIRQLILKMSGSMDALNARMERLEATMSANARQDAIISQKYAAATEEVMQHMDEMVAWRKEVIVRNASESERSERHDVELDQINIRCSRYALEISKVRTYAQDVHERVDLYEAKGTRNIAELGERLSRQSRLAYEDLQERLNECSERLDKGNEALVEQVKDMDARMDDFVVMDFHPIIDGRVHELMRELNYKVTHLGERTERLGTELNNHASRPTPGTEELRETVVQLQANMDCLHREQLETVVKLNAVDHCSLRLDRSVAKLRTGMERQDVVLNETATASQKTAGI